MIKNNGLALREHLVAVELDGSEEHVRWVRLQINLGDAYVSARRQEW